MKALIIDGFDEDCVVRSTALSSLQKMLKKKGFKPEVLNLADRKIRHCIGCFGCWVKTPGICVLKDQGQDTPRYVMSSSLVIMLTPITFGGYSSVLKKHVDRIIPIILPFFRKVKGEVHHKLRYDKYPKFLVIGVQKDDNAGERDIFKKLVHRNALNLGENKWETCILSEKAEKNSVMNKLRVVLNSLEVSE